MKQYKVKRRMTGRIVLPSFGDYPQIGTFTSAANLISHTLNNTGTSDNETTFSGRIYRLYRQRDYKQLEAILLGSMHYLAPAIFRNEPALTDSPRSFGDHVDCIDFIHQQLEAAVKEKSKATGKLIYPTDVVSAVREKLGLLSDQNFYKYGSDFDALLRKGTEIQQRLGLEYPDPPAAPTIEAASRLEDVCATVPVPDETPATVAAPAVKGSISPQEIAHFFLESQRNFVEALSRLGVQTNQSRTAP